MTTQTNPAHNSEQTNTQAQSEQTQAKKLTPNFSHRLSILGENAEPHLLSDAISTACLQAENTLSLVSTFFTGQTEDIQPSDELIFWTIEGVIQTIKDINAIVNEFDRVSQSANHKVQKNLEL
jgi:hypothetical protein